MAQDAPEADSPKVRNSELSLGGEDISIDESKEPLPRIQIKRDKAPLQQEETRFIEHPNAEKGLVKITRDRTYIYKVEKTPQTRASSVRFGIPEFTELANPDTGSTFDQNYDQTSNPWIMMDYEWQIWRSAIGKFGLTAGTGAYFATGNGRFETQNLTPRESFTFLALPTSGGIIYRMQFWDRQPIVPFGAAGGTVFPFAEIRDDDQPPKFGGAYASYLAAGAALNFSFLDTWSMLEMDRDYGINSVYLVGEFRLLIGHTNFDFSTNVVNAGFLVEF